MERLTSSDRPIFVVGCARSGTTLLQVMLHAHPRIAIPPENRFLLPAYDGRERWGDLREEKNRRELADWLVGRKKNRFRDLELDPDHVREQIVSGPPTLGSALGIVFREYAAKHGKPRWGDKRPAYVLRLHKILALFPDAQIVHLIRDGRDCVSSLKRMKWFKSDSVTAMWIWREAIRAGIDARDRLPAEQYHELHYEDLVSQPEPVLRRLCDFLGEEFSEQMLQHQTTAEKAVPERKSHHARTRKALDTKAVRRWEEDLEEWEIELMELMAWRELAEHGYEHSRRVPVPPPRKLLAFLRYDRRRRAEDREAAEEELAIRERYPYPVAARLTSRQRQLVG